MEPRTILAQIGQDAAGKWRAQLVIPGESTLVSPPCETEEEAIMQRDIAVEATVRAFSKRFIVNVNSSYGTIQ